MDFRRSSAFESGDVDLLEAVRRSAVSSMADDGRITALRGHQSAEELRRLATEHGAA